MNLAHLANLPRDKADTLLLLASALLVLAPHTLHLPLWVSLLCGATLAWRAAITLRGKRMPPSLILIPLAAGAMLGVMHTYQTCSGAMPGSPCWCCWWPSRCWRCMRGAICSWWSSCASSWC